jgi:hypothetical protein
LIGTTAFTNSLLLLFIGTTILQVANWQILPSIAVGLISALMNWVLHTATTADKSKNMQRRIMQNRSDSASTIGYWQASPPNKACTGQVGFCGFFKQSSGFEFFLLPNRVHARPPASNANRWAASLNRNLYYNAS